MTATMHRLWTAQDRAHALALRAGGFSDVWIASALDRSVGAIQRQIGPGEVRWAAAEEAGIVAAFLAIPTPRGTAGRLTWRGAA